jgi:hypothetical protein
MLGISTPEVLIPAAGTDDHPLVQLLETLAEPLKSA